MFEILKRSVCRIHFRSMPPAFFGMILAAALCGLSFALTAVPKTIGRTGIPYVPTQIYTVKDMLWMADVGKEDVVYDLGSGDGRIVISAVRDFGASRAVGIEIDPNYIHQSNENAVKANLADRVRFIQGDLFASDFSDADVVTLFLGHQPNIKLRPKLVCSLKPGSRIVSHQFAMGEWKPVKELTINQRYFGMWGVALGPFSNNLQVPDYTGNERGPDRMDKVFMWVIPAPIAGVWSGPIETQDGKQELKLVLQQNLNGIHGTFEMSGQTALTGTAAVDLYGSHLRCWCSPDGAKSGQFQFMFDGHVDGSTLEGKIAMIGKDQVCEYDYKAVRNKADFKGTWQWHCAAGSRQAQIRIETRDSQLSVVYMDQQQSLPVTDFYDFGGGFYFTLLIGENERGLAINDETGWLIGQAVVVNDALMGNILFYPTESIRGQAKSVNEIWTPQRIKP